MAYQALKSASVPMLIFHKEFLPTLQLATRRHNIRARERSWADVFGERMDKLGKAWLARPGRSCKLTDTKLVFLAPANETNRKAIAAMEASLAKFFARWSFRYYPVFSEALNRYKLVVEFRFDPELTPVVPIVPVDIKKEYELQLGFSKIKLSFYDKPSEDIRVRGMIAPLVLLEVFTQTGNTWHTTHTSAFKANQIGEVEKFLPCVAELFNRMQLNEARLS
jgi:hypothetical protein